MLFRKKNKDRENKVASYYDKHTRGYLDTYGDTIQAFRPSSLEELHRYIIKNAGIGDGMQLLDAGCGVCGPSMFFASNKDVSIDALTISPEQQQLARTGIANAGLSGRINVHLGDYHDLSSIFPADRYDLVLFLESLGHAHDSRKVIEEAWKVLRPGGCVYIKDFFPFDILDLEKARRHQFVIDRINESYAYNVLNLEATLRAMRQTGFEVIFIKKFEFVDDIQARFDFEEMFKIDLFGEMEEFRVAEWLELKFRKPESPLF